jgi:hypothetical protein
MLLTRRGQHVCALKQECCCTPKIGLVRLGPGKYTLDASKKPLMLRLVGKNVLVRVGSGWDSLRAFLQEHDPCRKHHALQTAKMCYDAMQKQLEADRRIASSINGHLALFTTRDVEK